MQVQTSISTYVAFSTCLSGEVYGRYVPQSVCNKDGQAQDVDIVLNEIFSDNEDVMVEFSNGPQPYRVRWAKACARKCGKPRGSGVQAFSCRVS